MLKDNLNDEAKSFLEKTRQVVFIFCYKFLYLFYTMIYFYFFPLFILILVFSYGKMPQEKTVYDFDMFATAYEYIQELQKLIIPSEDEYAQTDLWFHLKIKAPGKYFPGTSYLNLINLNGILVKI